MPLAALFVVQVYPVLKGIHCFLVSMPHAALFVVQVEPKWDGTALWSFNAARGFVCGASTSTILKVMRESSFNAARGFVCGASVFSSSFFLRSQFQCRTRLCLWCKLDAFPGGAWGYVFQCRTRLCLWCKRMLDITSFDISGFNAARGFVCGAR